MILWVLISSLSELSHQPIAPENVEELLSDHVPNNASHKGPMLRTHSPFPLLMKLIADEDEA